MAPPSTLPLAAAVLALAGIVTAQQPGTSTPEVHPKLTTYQCTTSGGCVAQDTSVVLDWNYRWMHDVNYNSCTVNGGVNSTICPNEATCGTNCFIEGVNYTASGVTTSGSSLTLNQYMPATTGGYSSVSPRLYLLDADGNYVLLQLNGKELSFDVDISALPCGENGSLYLSQMAANGGANQYNTAGANYGSGYCDAQCPVQAWKNGTLNTNNSGYCCNEMDILEGNSEANALTPHSCTATACDSSGCGLNPYASGFHSYYGPGLTVDTSKPFTIITQFNTDTGSPSGNLVSITRKYIQNGVSIPSAQSGGDIISSCPSASNYGGLNTIGKALTSGMVLIFSIWNDNSGFMNWLDSGSSGPCSSTEGNPATILANNPNTHITYSNIKWGDIGSTTSNGSSPPPVSSSSSSSKPPASSTTLRTSTTTSKTSTAPPSCTQTHWGQCGGNGYTGCKTCASGTTCQYSNDYYSQCL
ncbi:glycosylhydrolase family 7-1 [Trichoderma gamsii]|uniref:Glucanase n=1 Tax=Trichoderma gamsii TaxID=398673 RepID=A0A2P4ZG88_9HYPO|nr:glycosylhydrolase family 7-1 [Trichoderma gamsii]PON23316.1 glycosylhydrolase family 7-1 [Trichoderma gamsii]